MEVIVQGQSTKNFLIIVKDEHGEDQFNISDLLLIDENDLEREVKHCAADEHYWHQLAIDADHQREEFEKIDYAQYIAHTEKYAKYYLKGSGDKNFTGAARESAAMLIFSRKATEDDKKVYAETAYKGYTSETSSIGVKSKSLGEFTDDMFLYDPTYEDAQTHLLALKHRAERLKAVSSAFNTKSWSIKTLAADRRAAMQSNI